MLDWQDPFVRHAATAVRDAARMTVWIQDEKEGQHLTKEDKSPVTIGDFSVQALIACRLKRALPHFSLVAEESPESISTPETTSIRKEIVHYLSRLEIDVTEEKALEWIAGGMAEASNDFWTLDPIDGTKGFVRGEHYAVALGHIIDGKVQSGFLACPRLKESLEDAERGPGILMVAVRGQGAWVTDLAQEKSKWDPSKVTWRQVKVSDCQDLANARLLRSKEAAHTNKGKTVDLMHASGMTQVIPMDSMAKYTLLAGGGAEVLIRFLSKSKLDYREFIWDQAAGVVILEEAGGKITDLDGKALDFSHGKRLIKNRGILATNERLHAPMLEWIRKIEAIS